MGCILKLDYSIYLDDGRVLKEGRGKEVRLGMRALWGTGADIGLLSMKVGERAIVSCEAEFAGPQDGHPRTTLDLRLIAILGDGVGITPNEMRYIKAMSVFGFFFCVWFLYKEGFFKGLLQ